MAEAIRVAVGVSRIDHPFWSLWGFVYIVILLLLPPPFEPPSATENFGLNIQSVSQAEATSARMMVMMMQVRCGIVLWYPFPALSIGFVFFLGNGRLVNIVHCGIRWNKETGWTHKQTLCLFYENILQMLWWLEGHYRKGVLWC
jgi:hypothetical protein